MQKNNKRWRLRNKFLNIKNIKREIDGKVYNKQSNLRVTLIKQAEKEFFGHTNVRGVTDNIKIWKTVKPLVNGQN